jgi:hypothetical protein
MPDPCRHARPIAACLALGACLALAACGGSAPAANSAAQEEVRGEKFARCMREHGVDVQVAKSSGGGGAANLRITGRAAGIKGNIHSLEAAQQACAKYRPLGAKENLSPAERAQRQDQVLKFARCMREHGIEVPNPSTTGGLGIQLRGVNPESPKFQSAQKACQSILPFPRGSRGGGPSTSTQGGAGAGPSTSVGIG